MKNELFNSLCEINVDRWVDVESEYYTALLKIIDNKPEDEWNNNRDIEVAKLNSEMDDIARRFDKYLKENVVDEIKKSFNSAVESIFRNDSYTSSIDAQEFLKEFSSKNHEDLNRILSAYSYSRKICPKYRRTVVLNFNYTKTFEDLYFKVFRKKLYCLNTKLL